LIYQKHNEEASVAVQLVVGLYESKGYAQDARNRLHTEGMPYEETSLVVIHDIAAVPASTAQTELAALSVDPLILGDVEKTFARFIKNGETALIVSAATDIDVEFVTDILTLYDPLSVEVIQARPAREVK
jgi:hypothetical protein